MASEQPSRTRDLAEDLPIPPLVVAELARKQEFESEMGRTCNR